MKYALIDGELMNSTHPDTFELAARDERETVDPGRWVKLGFQPLNADGYAERMWVKVTSRTAPGSDALPFYAGTVDNKPFDIAEDVVKLGDEVHFMPQHILSIME